MITIGFAGTERTVFDAMEPVSLANCEHLLRPRLSAANLSEYQNESGTIRFVIAVDENHEPMLFLLSSYEFHDSFSRRQFVKPFDAKGRTKLIYGKLIGDFEDQPPMFRYELRGARRSISDEASLAIFARLLAENIHLPGVTFRDLDSGIQTTAEVLPQNAEIYHAGWAVGRLMFVSSVDIPRLLATGELNVRDIVVLNDVPEDIPAFLGVVTTSAQGRLSHLDSFAHMMDFPFVYIPEDQLEPYRKFHGRHVILKVESRPATLDEVTAGLGPQIPTWKITPPLGNADFSSLLTLKAKRPIVLPAIDDVFSGVTLLSDLEPMDVTRFGAKATNLGFLHHVLGKDSVPHGLAVPYYYYSRFLSMAKVEKISLHDFIHARLARLTSSAGPPLTFLEEDEILSQIRSAIQAAQIPWGLLHEIVLAGRRFLPENGRGYLLRSSSSAEDGKDFNGAGLYRSTVISELTGDALESALKEIFSSLYLPKGFYARRRFQMDETRVAMGVVIHPAHEAPQLANGVSRMRWGVERTWESHWIDVDHSILRGNQDLVTSPSLGVIPENLRMSIDGRGAQKGQILSGQTTILTPELLSSLNRALARIARYWPRPAQGVWQSLDLEWYVVGEGADGPGRLVVRQVRDHPQRPTEAPFDL